MSKEEGYAIMVTEVFNNKRKQKVSGLSVSLSSSAVVFLFCRVHRIYDLREMLKKRAGANFKLKQFHANFLVIQLSGKKFI
jgi:hypothetical protein